MSTSSASIRAWSRLLPAVEAANRSASGTQMDEAVRVSEKLRISLTQFVGKHGFTALLRRAGALARADIPSLQNVKVTADGRLEGIEEFVSDPKTGIEAGTGEDARQRP